jgi:(R,R)-butanediol dehydrogenase/meso-butanediol dehydrogenase/diacetyl reductase
MRAAYYEGQSRIAVRDVDAHEPGPGEVQLKVAYVGICGTDLHVLDGDMDARVTLPAILGHEMSGTVTAVGNDVTEWAPGDEVVVVPLDWCGTCPACVRGNSHICYRLNFIGIDSPGAMQNFWNVAQRTLIRIPANLALKEAALAEPTAVAVHDVRRSELRPGQKALVVGGGPIGLLIASVAAAAGGDVLVSEPNSQRRDLIERIGIRTVDAANELGAVVDEWTEGAGVDVSFEVSGSAGGVDAAVSSLGARGRLTLVAIHSRPAPVDLFKFFWRELTLVGARVYESGDFEEALRLLGSGAIPTDALITDVVALADAPAAFERLRAGLAMKVLIDCGVRT